MVRSSQMEVLPLQPGYDFPSKLVREDCQTFGGSFSNNAEEWDDPVVRVMSGFDYRVLLCLELGLSFPIRDV